MQRDEGDFRSPALDLRLSLLSDDLVDEGDWGGLMLSNVEDALEEDLAFDLEDDFFIEGQRIIEEIRTELVTSGRRRRPVE